jgi:pimeloyl-ACP methyl ester carboxylesterase
MDRPVTRYATTEDDIHIAYQVLGNGPIDVVFVHAFVSHVELFWELSSYARFFRELSSWGRAIMFDKRGVGLSDRLSIVPTLEARIDDLRAVLDAVESERILLVGNSDGGALAAMFAATYPERTLGLVPWSGGVRMAWAPDYPWGMREELPTDAGRISLLELPAQPRDLYRPIRCLGRYFIDVGHRRRISPVSTTPRCLALPPRHAP